MIIVVVFQRIRAKVSRNLIESITETGGRGEERGERGFLDVFLHHWFRFEWVNWMLLIGAAERHNNGKYTCRKVLATWFTGATRAVKGCRGCKGYRVTGLQGLQGIQRYRLQMLLSCNSYKGYKCAGCKIYRGCKGCERLQVLQELHRYRVVRATRA